MVELSSEQSGSVTIVMVSGSIDAITAAEVVEFLDEKLGAGNYKLVMDFSKVEYVSSAGLRVLLGTMKTTRSNDGDLRLASIADDVYDVLEMAGFTGILKIFDSRDEAVQSFEA